MINVGCIDVSYSIDGHSLGQSYWNNWDANTDRSYTTTIINLALLYDQTNVAEILIKKGVNLLIKDNRGNTALHIASCVGHKTVVSMILKKSKPQDIDQRNHEGLTALLMAVHYERADVVEELLKNFANPLITDKYGDTALHLAIAQALGAEVISMIIDAVRQQTINLLRQNKITVLCRARDVIREVISEFINLQNRTGKTALMIAVTDMNCIVELLLENGADHMIVDSDGNTALGAASMFARDENFISPLLIAVRKQMINNLRQNVMGGPSVLSGPNLVENDRDRDMIRDSMLEFINCRNHRGRTALHLAFTFQDCPVDTVKNLLKHDADPRIPDNYGKTVLDLAIKKKQHDAITEIVNAVRNMPKLHFLQNGMTPPLYSGSINRSKHHHLPSGIISVIFTDDMIKQWKRSAENALKWAMSTKRDDLVDSLKIICDDITETGQPIDSSKQLPSVVNDC
uniref:Uncharacterized protein n=1 Tax=Spongospora subterranea TaxID=70186 RepID=A0A0H5R1P8_9EUKA|eukprot:CRZ07876.1 hypothetical protein [Spongospora subterranea]